MKQVAKGVEPNSTVPKERIAERTVESMSRSSADVHGDEMLVSKIRGSASQGVERDKIFGQFCIGGCFGGVRGVVVLGDGCRFAIHQGLVPSLHDVVPGCAPWVVPSLGLPQVSQK